MDKKKNNNGVPISFLPIFYSHAIEYKTHEKLIEIPNIIDYINYNNIPTKRFAILKSIYKFSYKTEYFYVVNLPELFKYIENIFSKGEEYFNRFDRTLEEIFSALFYHIKYFNHERINLFEDFLVTEVFKFNNPEGPQYYLSLLYHSISDHSGIDESDERYENNPLSTLLTFIASLYQGIFDICFDTIPTFVNNIDLIKLYAEKLEPEESLDYCNKLLDIFKKSPLILKEHIKEIKEIIRDIKSEQLQIHDNTENKEYEFGHFINDKFHWTGRINQLAFTLSLIVSDLPIDSITGYSVAEYIQKKDKIKFNGKYSTLKSRLENIFHDDIDFTPATYIDDAKNILIKILKK